MDILDSVPTQKGQFDYQYHEALEGTLSEWNTKEDDEAFNDL